MRVTRDVAMVPSHFLILNHLLIVLAHNSPAGPSHPNAIGGIYTTKGGGVVRPALASLVSYEVVGGDAVETNSIYASCSVGCASCSPVNGCLVCRPPFLLTLRREGARQIPSCLPSCPPGFYKTRVDQYRVCASCHLPGCSVCNRGGRCSLCEEGYVKNSKSGHCVKVTEAAESSMLGSDPSEPRTRGPRRKGRPSRRKLRKRRRKKGRKLSAGRRRRLRGRRTHKSRGRGNPHKKLKKHKKLNPAENEVAISSEPMPPFSLKGSTSLNLGQVRPRKLNHRRRNRRRRGRRRRKRMGLRARKSFSEERKFSSEFFVSEETSPDSIVTLHRDRPLVSLARPSRHIHVGQNNDTYNLTHTLHTVNDTFTHLIHASEQNPTHHSHTKRSDISNYNSIEHVQKGIRVSIFSRGGDEISTLQTHENRATSNKTSESRTNENKRRKNRKHRNRTNAYQDQEEPESNVLNLIGHQYLDGASPLDGGKPNFKFNSDSPNINNARKLAVDTQQILGRSEIPERRRQFSNGVRTRRNRRRRQSFRTRLLNRL